MARPHKPSALRDLEGNRSRRDIPPDMPLQGVPECPDVLTGEARRHFNFIAAEYGGIGVLKRLDGEGLALLAWTWGQFWETAVLAELGEPKAMQLALAIQKAWWAAASKLGIPPTDRARLMAAPTEKPDEQEERFFKVTG